MALTHSELGHLVASLLSVNGFGAPRAASLLPAFLEQGLLNPKVVAAMSHDELIDRMSRAGYARGGFLPILSYRLAQLMEAVADGKLDVLRHQVEVGSEKAFGDALAAVHGWGPRTIDTAWAVWRDALGK